MITLGIETSCDETACAVIQDGIIRSNEIFSQIAIHAPYGGVVPEIASRNHVLKIRPIVDHALTHASIRMSDVDAIGVTVGPGLVGSLLVGAMFAKTLAYVHHKKIVPINHIEGHLLAVFLESTDIAFPFIGLVVSGGHTHLYMAKNFGNYTCLGRTRDDAAGEAFDKISKYLGLGYPGGPIISSLAEGGNHNFVKFPRGLAHDKSYDFSFSGLKTSFVNYAKKNDRDIQTNRTDVLASFEEAIADSLVTKSLAACHDHGINQLVIAGGVACNKRLRHKATTLGAKDGVRVFFPSPILCTDNAAMIAYVAEQTIMADNNRPWDSLDIDVKTNMKL